MQRMLKSYHSETASPVHIHKISSRDTAIHFGPLSCDRENAKLVGLQGMPLWQESCRGIALPSISGQVRHKLDVM